MRELGAGESLDVRRHVHHRQRPAIIPGRARAGFVAASPESAALAKELKRRRFRFVGPTTAYSLMQAAGIVNDHAVGCCVRGAVEAEQLAAAARFA